MDHLKFIVNHVRLVNLANNSIGAFNLDIEYENILDEATKSNYIKQFISAKSFEYQFHLYSLKFNVPKSVSVYESLKDNLNTQTCYLLEAIDNKSPDHQNESIQTDLANIKAVLEISEISPFVRDHVCSTIHKFTQRLLTDFNEKPAVDFKEFNQLYTLLERLKKILQFKVLIEGLADCEFKLQMEIIFETAKIGMKKKLDSEKSLIDQCKSNK